MLITRISVCCLSVAVLIAGCADGDKPCGIGGSFGFPDGVASDSAGNLFVADAARNTILKITPAGEVATFAGAAGVPGSTDGTADAALFRVPTGLAIDSAGNVYVADEGNHTVRAITPAGVVSTLAGTALSFGSTDATGSAARFFSPRSVATDSAGNVYVADWQNHTIRKITPAGMVSTIAGTAGALGYVDATGADARFTFPRAVATDAAGNVYVADGNSTIRKITPTGVVTTFAGTAGSSGSTDATGADARFSSPSGLATDSASNLYVADTFNNTIRKITPAALVSTIAGSAGTVGSVDATGAAARFNIPVGLTVDGAGNLYVADAENTSIRKITPTGVVTTYAGSVRPACPITPNPFPA